MLKRRIRELERMVRELKGTAASETESIGASEASSSVLVDREDASTPVSVAVGTEGLYDKVEKLTL